MIKALLMVVAVAIAALLIVAATKPDVFVVQRSIDIKAPAEKIFPLINDFHRWEVWSPYEKLDPAMKRSYRGAADGIGAVYAWEGNGKAGAGSMEITEQTPPSHIGLSLKFTRPFAAHNTVDFTLQPSGDSTRVTWAMRGPLPYMAKVMHVIFNMDKMVGNDFSVGLVDLKTAAEK